MTNPVRIGLASRRLLVGLAAAAALFGAGTARAAQGTYQFTGTTSSTMSVNDGTSVGTIGSGTPFAGTLAFEEVQTANPAAFGGGSHTVYTFDTMSLSIGSTTVSWGPGRIDVYDNLTSTSSGYPIGDSMYANINGVPPSGTINGAQFNFIFLGLVDSTGTAISGGALPGNLDFGSFQSRFIEFNYGTRGTPWGAGNTSTLQFLSSLTKTSGPVPTPSPTLPPPPTPTPPPAPCSGSNAVETAYVARNPGYIVVNGGLNLLDHLWTTNLNAGNTTFLGGLTNWYQTGLILSYTGTTDPNGCILDHLTVAPGVTIGTTALPAATTGVAYQAPVSAIWGVAPYALTIAGLPAGLSFDGTTISGTPTVAGTYNLTISATDAVGASTSAPVSLTVNQGGSYTVKDEGKGKITAVDPNYTYVMVNNKKLLVTSATTVIVNTPTGERHVLDGFVQVGMRVQWKGLRDKATNTVLTSFIEIN